MMSLGVFFVFFIMYYDRGLILFKLYIHTNFKWLCMSLRGA